MKARLALSGCALAATLSLAAATPAFAYGPTAANITTNSSTTGPGNQLTVTGAGFAPDTTITLTLHSVVVTLGTTTSDATGAFSAVVTIPSTTAIGAHEIVATDPEGDSAATDITVGTAVTPVLASTTSGLAFTGADIAALSGVGALALALGGMLLLTGRQRRARAE